MTLTIVTNNRPAVKETSTFGNKSTSHKRQYLSLLLLFMTLLERQKLKNLVTHSHIRIKTKILLI